MTTITRSSLLSYTPKQMYDLVNDIEAYSKFLPWCNNSRIISKYGNTIDASLDLAQGGICHTFSTSNKLTEDELISIKLIDGPFKHLEGHWQFKPIAHDAGCQVKLYINFTFSNSIISMALEPIFTQISSSLIHSFCKRAQDIYDQY